MAKEEIDDRDEDEIDDDAPEDDDGKESVEDESKKAEPGKKEEKEPEIEIVEDERLVTQHKKPEDESVEEKRTRRKKEKLEKTQRRRDAERRDKALIRQLHQQNQQLSQRLQGLESKVPAWEQRISSQDEIQLDTAIQQQQGVYNTALARLNKAISEGNGADAADAQRYISDSQGKYNQLVQLKQNIDLQKRNATQTNGNGAAQPRQVDDTQKALTQRWIIKNDWYDPNGGDEDSQAAREIATQLAKEGYVANTKEHWDELDRRVQEELPHLYEGKSQRKSTSPKPRQINGNLGADSYSGAEGKIRIPKTTMDMARDAGFLDDPVKKKRFIENWKQQNGASA